MEAEQLDCVPKGSSQPRSSSNSDENAAIKEGALLQRVQQQLFLRNLLKLSHMPPCKTIFGMQWIETGVFDAIEKRYLKSLSLVVAKLSDDENDD